MAAGIIQKNRDLFFLALFELSPYLLGFIVFIFAHNLFLLVFSLILMAAAGVFIFTCGDPDRDLHSVASLRKREIEVNQSSSGAFDLCMKYIDRLPSKTIVLSDPVGGVIEVATPKKLFPCIGKIQYYPPV